MHIDVQVYDVLVFFLRLLLWRKHRVHLGGTTIYPGMQMWAVGIFEVGHFMGRCPVQY